MSTYEKFTNFPINQENLKKKRKDWNMALYNGLFHRFSVFGRRIISFLLLSKQTKALNLYIKYNIILLDIMKFHIQCNEKYIENKLILMPIL